MSGYSISVFNIDKRFYPIQLPTLRDLLSSKKNKESIVACDAISFNVERGQLLGIMGPNGSGKTTLIRILSGVIIPDAGTAKINGLDVIKESTKARISLGVAFGDVKNFYIRLTGRENLKLFAAFSNMQKKESEKRIDELVSLLGLHRHLDKMFQENSTGIKQKFALARSLLNDTPVLLLDEPTKHIDPSTAEMLRKYIKNELVEKRKKTVLFTSHLCSEVADIADRIAILNKGQIKALGTLSELSKSSGISVSELNNIYNFYTNK